MAKSDLIAHRRNGGSVARQPIGGCHDVSPGLIAGSGLKPCTPHAVSRGRGAHRDSRHTGGTTDVPPPDHAGLRPDAGHEITIDIDVQRNTSGCSRDMSVTVDDLDFEAAYDLEQQVTNSMTSENSIWEQFCSSEEAEQYYETDD